VCEIQLSSHLCLGLSSGLLPSGFPHPNPIDTSLLPIRATCPAHLLDFITRISLSTYIIIRCERNVCVPLLDVRCRSQWQSQWTHSIYGYTKHWKWLPFTRDKNHVRYRLKLKDLIFDTSRPTVWEPLLRMATEALQRRRDGLQVTPGPNFMQSRDSSVSTVTELRATRPMNRASIPGTVKTHSSALQHPGRFWGTSRYLHNRYCGFKPTGRVYDNSNPCNRKDYNACSHASTHHSY